MTKEQEEKLLRDVSQLMEWMKTKERQQISFPLDETSKNIIDNI